MYTLYIVSVKAVIPCSHGHHHHRHYQPYCCGHGYSSRITSIAAKIFFCNCCRFFQSCKAWVSKSTAFQNYITTADKITTKTTTFLLHNVQCTCTLAPVWENVTSVGVCPWTVFIVYKCRLFLYGCKNLNWMPDDGIRGLPIRLNKSI